MNNVNNPSFAKTMANFVNRLLLIAAFAFIHTAWCDDPAAETDYVTISPNGEFILVILSSDDDRSNSNEIRKSYANSGIFTKSGFCVYKIDNYLWRGIITNDGIAFGLGPWAHRDDFDEIGYYVFGKNLAKSRAVKDYITDFSMVKKSVSHYRSIYDYRYDIERKRIIIITYESKVILLDSKTGLEVSILSER